MSRREEMWVEVINPDNPLKPEDTLEYYETQMIDPTSKLSDRDKFLISKWMKDTENSSTTPDTATLSDRDNAFLERLNAKANTLPANENFKEPISLFAHLENKYNQFYSWMKGWNKYTWDL